jgi:hypothetical protein
MTQKAVTKTLTSDQATVYGTLTTVSAKIRFLAGEGYTTGDVSRIMTELEGRLVRFQHVRNVLITPLKRQG